MQAGHMVNHFNPLQSYPLALRIISILYSRLYLLVLLPNHLFILDFSSKILYAFISLLYATCPGHLFLLDFITLTITYMVEYSLQSYSLCNCFVNSCYILFPRSNILLIIPFSSSLALCYFTEGQPNSHIQTKQKLN
jgi:hypothetical protein